MTLPVQLRAIVVVSSAIWVVCACNSENHVSKYNPETQLWGEVLKIHEVQYFTEDYDSSTDSPMPRKQYGHYYRYSSKKMIMALSYEYMNDDDYYDLEIQKVIRVDGTQDNPTSMNRFGYDSLGNMQSHVYYRFGELSGELYYVYDSIGRQVEERANYLESGIRVVRRTC